MCASIGTQSRSQTEVELSSVSTEKALGLFHTLVCSSVCPISRRLSEITPRFLLTDHVAMNATLPIAANGMAAGHCMSGVPGSPAWAEATMPDDVRAGLETPELHEEALPYEEVVAMTPHGMMPPGPYEAGKGAMRCAPSSSPHDSSATTTSRVFLLDTSST